MAFSPEDLSSFFFFFFEIILKSGEINVSIINHKHAKF